jgi:hypothetical protein
MSMAERHNIIVCSFDPASPRITAWDIYEWIYATLKIPHYEVKMIQIEGIRRQVFIKLINTEKVEEILRQTAGQLDYKYPTG